MTVARASSLLLVLCVLGAWPRAQAPASSQSTVARAVAITIDDAPFVNAGRTDYLRRATEKTTRLIDALAAHRVSATVLVNERQLSEGGPGEVEARTALLARWVAAGHVLGNHTYSHPDANAVTADAYAEDIVRGEPVTLRLMAARVPYQRYFRHPFTHTGDTPEKKAAIEAVLAQRGYVVTPHTIENADWYFNGPYVRAALAGDTARHARLRDAYLAHTADVVRFAEQASLRVFGREIPHVLLIHTNDITADHLSSILERFTARGYRFVTLDEAMRDVAYRTKDTWVGRSGPSWLFRWSRSLGQTVSFADEPEAPAWVNERAPE